MFYVFIFKKKNLTKCVNIITLLKKKGVQLRHFLFKYIENYFEDIFFINNLQKLSLISTGTRFFTTLMINDINV